MMNRCSWRESIPQIASKKNCDKTVRNARKHCGVFHRAWGHTVDQNARGTNDLGKTFGGVPHPSLGDPILNIRMTYLPRNGGYIDDLARLPLHHVQCQPLDQGHRCAEIDSDDDAPSRSDTCEEGMAELGIGVVMVWTLPGSMLMRECAMLLLAAVLWSCAHMEKPVAEGRHT
jgi:hypothetical protein